MKEAKSRRKVQLDTVATKTATPNARVAQKHAVVDMTPEAVAPKSKRMQRMFLKLMMTRINTVTIVSPMHVMMSCGIPLAFMKQCGRKMKLLIPKMLTSVKYTYLSPCQK